LGAAVETLNATPDGRFPARPSEPTAEHCRSLARTVPAVGADLGIAHDGDADRTMAVTADGEFLPGDVLLAILGRAAVEAADPDDPSAPVRVAAPVDTSLAVDDALAPAGAAVVRTPVGDVHVAARATEPGVVFGGEPSGAWIFPGETLCPDGPLAAVRLAALAAAEPLADRAAAVDRYPIRRESIETGAKAAATDRIRERVNAEYDDVSRLDGVRVDRGDGWFLLRASGTQPLVRITAEAREPDRADAILAEARALAADAVEAAEAGGNGDGERNGDG